MKKFLRNKDKNIYHGMLTNLEADEPIQYITLSSK